MIQQLLLSIAAISLVFSPGLAPTRKSYHAERFDVDVTVQLDGSLLVTESVEFYFEGEPFTYVFRELPLYRTDGIDVISARMDGAALPAGEQAGHAEVSGRDPIKVVWHFAPTTDQAHTFVLTYRMWGVVQQTADADLLLWDTLPDEHAYTITRSTVRIHYPEGVDLLSAPEVRAGSADVEQGDATVAFTAHTLGPDENFTVALRFQRGSLITDPPQWQQSQGQADASKRYSLVAVSVAIFVLLIGFLTIFRYRMHYRRQRAGDSAVLTTPPSSLPPAIAGVLANDGNLQLIWSYALATLFDLAERGVIEIEEASSGSWWRRQDFRLHLRSRPADLHPHERGLITALFESKHGMQTSCTLHTLESDLQRRLKHFSKPLEEELWELGLFGERYQRGRNTFLIWGCMLLGLSLLSLLAAILWLRDSSLGIWPLMASGSLFLIGIMAFIASNTISPLSDAGREQARAWQSFARYLQDVTRGRESLIYTKLFIDYLPYAAAFGLAQAWAKYLKKRESFELPRWFHALASSYPDSNAAFVAMVYAANTTGANGGVAGAAGAAGAASAGGAAGGGASGAG